MWSPDYRTRLFRPTRVLPHYKYTKHFKTKNKKNDTKKDKKIAKGKRHSLFKN